MLSRPRRCQDRPLGFVQISAPSWHRAVVHAWRNMATLGARATKHQLPTSSTPAISFISVPNGVFSCLVRSAAAGPSMRLPPPARPPLPGGARWLPGLAPTDPRTARDPHTTPRVCLETRGANSRTRSLGQLHVAVPAIRDCFYSHNGVAIGHSGDLRAARHSG